jgi:hypothetical protein
MRNTPFLFFTTRLRTNDPAEAGLAVVCSNNRKPLSPGVLAADGVHVQFWLLPATEAFATRVL